MKNSNVFFIRAVFMNTKCTSKSDLNVSIKLIVCNYQEWVIIIIFYEKFKVQTPWISDNQIHCLMTNPLEMKSKRWKYFCGSFNFISNEFDYPKFMDFGYFPESYSGSINFIHSASWLNVCLKSVVCNYLVVLWKRNVPCVPLPLCKQCYNLNCKRNDHGTFQTI